MSSDQKLLQEAYAKIWESATEPLYFGPEDKKDAWMRWFDFQQYKQIHEDGSISIDNNVILDERKLTAIPFKFKEVGGAFDCSNNQLRTLKGCPEVVKGSFNCSINLLENLKYAPTAVKGSFSCTHNPHLISLEGCPAIINGHFYCSATKLSNFLYGPTTVKGNFECYRTNLESLEGAPDHILGVFDTTTFSQEDYETYIRKRKIIDKKLPKELDVDLDF